jgi:hypothetical protein
VRDGEFRNERGADHIYAQHLLPVGDSGVLHAFLGEIRGVVHQDVDRAKICNRAFGNLAGLGFLRDIGYREHGLRTQIFKFFERGISRTGGDVVEYQPRTFFGEAKRDGFADARSRARNDGGFSG